MELGLPRAVVQEQEEVSAVGEAAAVRWEEHALEPDLVGIAFAPIEEWLISVVSIGHPAEAPEKGRKGLDEITFANKYGLHLIGY